MSLFGCVARREFAADDYDDDGKVPECTFIKKLWLLPPPPPLLIPKGVKGAERERGRGRERGREKQMERNFLPSVARN